MAQEIYDVDYYYSQPPKAQDANSCRDCGGAEKISGDDLGPFYGVYWDDSLCGAFEDVVIGGLSDYKEAIDRRADELGGYIPAIKSIAHN